MTGRPGAHTHPAAVRHPAALMLRARELRAAGWSLRAVCDILAREGADPAPTMNSVWRWTADPQRVGRHDTARMTRTRLARLPARTFSWPGTPGPEWRLERMRRLRAGGLSYHAIAVVMTLDFPRFPRTEWGVRLELLEASSAGTDSRKEAA